ncbi:hypothetical protein Rhe02_52110 [Rhizocola hellebori]|uniref:Uncharacterized protein n=1 Tax=Rhizocola hellebori TaxID=1392758 RepID=A0A8J3QBZ8_9ACTN|nr:hypothetical protein [Rhizocola hellebori]GIH07144.1 hypothetical protein Rhe02_52110 [Rhizocola hellebori]
MLLPYRLDMMLDLFSLCIDGHTIVVSQEQLQRIHDQVDAASACWPELKAPQVWTAVIEALGHDPRT